MSKLHPIFQGITDGFVGIPEKITAASVTEGTRLPESNAEIIARLMWFYSVETLEQLVVAQNRHVEKLQTYGAPRLGDDIRRTPREG